MDHQQAQNIIATLKSYSAAAEEALLALGKYDYREEANQWNDHSQPKLLEPEHPTLRGLYHRLVHHITTIPYYPHNIERDSQVNRTNIAAFVNYITVSNDTQTAAAFNRIAIEPMQGITTAFTKPKPAYSTTYTNSPTAYANGTKQPRTTLAPLSP